MSRTAKAIESKHLLVPDLSISMPDTFFCYTWQNISINQWIGQPTIEAVKQIGTTTRKLIRQYPGGHSNVTFVFQGVPGPTPEVQSVFDSVFDNRRSRIACMAIVLEGSGFWASGIRSSVVGMNIRSPGQLALRIFNTIEEAVQWLPREHMNRTGVQIEASQLKTVLSTAREKVSQVVQK